MFNSPLLLLRPAKSGKDYTHIVHVSSKNLGMIGTALGLYNDVGSITPTSFNENAVNGGIAMLYSQSGHFGDNTTFEVNTFLADYQVLYLGRPDTKLAMGHPYTGSEESGTAFWNGILFTEADVGKDIPIWLSYAPPLGKTRTTDTTVGAATSRTCQRTSLSGGRVNVQRSTFADGENENRASSISGEVEGYKRLRVLGRRNLRGECSTRWDNNSLGLYKRADYRFLSGLGRSRHSITRSSRQVFKPSLGYISSGVCHNEQLKRSIHRARRRLGLAANTTFFKEVA